MNKTWRYIYMALLALALVLRAWVYIQGALHLPVTTDEAITILQAKRIAEGELQWLMFAQPYMIPFEAYAAVALLDLPRNAFGMRALVVVEGLLLLGATLWLIRRMGDRRSTWAGWLMALFPSAYILTNTFGYSLPHNNSAYLLALMGVVGAQQLQRDDTGHRYRVAWLLWTGFFCGLAFSNAMLTLTIIIPLMLVVLLNGRIRQIPLTIGGLAVGTLLGLAPFLYTKLVFEGSHVGVSQSRDLQGAWDVLTQHLLAFTLPRTLGMGAPVFPDEPVYAFDLGRAVAVFGYTVSVGFAVALIARAVTHLRGLFGGRGLKLTLVDFALGVWLINLAAFAKSARSAHLDFRYMMPTALVLPLALAGFQQMLPRRAARIFLGLVVAYAGFNVASTLKTTSVWAEPDFARTVVNTPDLTHALDILRQNDIRHCYAQHWTAYRINFLTDEAILCSQPYNSRFPTWPLPYKATVDAANPVAYVLTARNRFITPSVFRSHLQAMGVTCRVEQAGDYEVFLDFQPPANLQGRAVVAPDRIQALRSDDFPGDLLATWTDNNLFSRSHSYYLQKDGMAFEVELTEPATLAMLRYNLGFWREDEPGALHVDVRDGGEWKRVVSAGIPTRDPFAFRKAHPVYGGNVRSLAFQPVRTDAIRVTTVKANPKRAWTFAEFELLEVPDANINADN